MTLFCPLCGSNHYQITSDADDEVQCHICGAVYVVRFKPVKEVKLCEES